MNRQAKTRAFVAFLALIVGPLLFLALTSCAAEAQTIKEGAEVAGPTAGVAWLLSAIASPAVTALGAGLTALVTLLFVQKTSLASGATTTPDALHELKISIADKPFTSQATSVATHFPWIVLSWSLVVVLGFMGIRALLLGRSHLAVAWSHGLRRPLKALWSLFKAGFANAHQ